MTAITTICLNKWECAKTSSYTDQIGPNEIKMPINPAVIAAVRFRKTLKYAENWACSARHNPDCSVLKRYLPSIP